MRPPTSLGSLAVVGLLVGCSSDRVVPYPARWPALPPIGSAGASALSGRYQDKGEWAEPSQALFTLLVFGVRSPWADATEVALQAESESLRITVFNGPNVLLTRTFTQAAGEYSTAGGRFTIHTQMRVQGEGSSGDQEATFEFFPLSDSVVVREQSRGRGTSMGIPSRWTSDDWARFQKLNAGE